VTPHRKLESLHTTAGTSVIPTATVSIRAAAIGDGPVDAIFKEVARVTGIAIKLREFADRAVASARTLRAKSRSNSKSRATTGPSAAAPPRPTSSRPRPSRTSTPSTPSSPASIATGPAR
jgi:hypothetical protein